MSETILRISEERFKAVDKYGNNNTFEGYVVLTDKRAIKVGISDFQSCCENWGYVSSEDNLDEFVGANLISMNWTDDELRTYDELPEYETVAMFVTFVTDRGTFQLVMYNSHNGYYSHDAVVVVDDTVLERSDL